MSKKACCSYLLHGSILSDLFSILFSMWPVGIERKRVIINRVTWKVNWNIIMLGWSDLIKRCVSPVWCHHDAKVDCTIQLNVQNNRFWGRLLCTWQQRSVSVCKHDLGGLNFNLQNFHKVKLLYISSKILLIHEVVKYYNVQDMKKKMQKWTISIVRILFCKPTHIISIFTII